MFTDSFGNKSPADNMSQVQYEGENEVPMTQRITQLINRVEDQIRSKEFKISDRGKRVKRQTMYEIDDESDDEDAEI